MPRLWIDLTDLADWNGAFTGIQHTVFNLASRYAVRPEVGFVVFDDVYRGFVTVPFARVASRAQSTDRGGRGNAIKVAQRILDHLPGVMRDRLLGQTSRRLRRRVERALGLHPAGGIPLSLASQDRVLVAGASWHNDAVLPELGRLKRQVGCRLIAVVHDLMPVFHAEFYPAPFPSQFRDHMRSLFPLADLLLANSRHTQGEVQRFCAQEGLPAPRCLVFRLGDSRASVPPVTPQQALAPGGFILAVGLDRRKNAGLLCQMVRLAQKEGVPLPPLVIAGRPSWIKDDHAALMSLCNAPEVKGRIHVLTDVSDGHLAWLYQNCRFTIFPSLCEGWGLPVAESLAQGKVCLASSATSIPEVGGDLADYASPHDPGAFLQLAHKYLNPQRLAEREASIRTRYRPFDWDQAFAAFDTMMQQLEEG